MRKQIIDLHFEPNLATTQSWIDLEMLAQVQVSSEQATHPIELALVATPEQSNYSGPGWLAAEAGKQSLRILFDKPQNIKLIHLLFRETKQSRTQEFWLRYSTDGNYFREILRQQYTFSPPASCLQVENYQVELQSITSLELTILPDISGGSALASLAALRLA